MNKILISTIALAWAIFQMSLPQILLLDSLTVRTIHLAFALALAFVMYQNPKKSTLQSIFQILLMIGGVVSALYLNFFWEEVASRFGNPSTTDLVMGSLLIVILLEAVRIKVGLGLSLIVGFFSFYAFFGAYFPEFMVFKGVSLQKYITQISLSSEGIFGIPLGISASTVFLFVLLGGLLEKAGAGKFFVNLALSMLGKFRGGSAKAAVISSGLMGMISGSSIANVVTSGTFTIPLMKKTGYPAQKAAAIEVAASTDGQIMPPIMGAAAFIIAEYVNIPYTEVVRAALIPALLSSVGLFYITHLEACKMGLKGLKKSEIPQALKTLMSGLHYLLVIGVLLYELFVLQHTPETSCYKAILCLLIIIIIQELWSQKNIKDGLSKAIKIIKSGSENGAKNMVTVALATAASGIIVGVVNMGIGGMMTEMVEILSQGNIFLMLFITAITCLLLGIGLPTTATYIVMASLTAPIIVTLGSAQEVMIPLIAAHLFCFYFGILADDTPPVGLAAYAAASIAKSDPIKTGLQSFSYDIRTAIIPFFFVFNTQLLLIGVEHLWEGVLIFIMGALGMILFTSGLQGWFLRKNIYYEIPFFFLATLLLLHPTSLFDNRMTGYGVGLIIGVGLYLWQKSHKE